MPRSDGVADTALVVPSGRSWNELQRIIPLLSACEVVYSETDPVGFRLNEQRTQIVLTLRPPKITTTAVCNGDGSITFTHVLS